MISGNGLRTGFGIGIRTSLTAAALGLTLVSTGCRSSQDKANEQAVAQAKQQAAAMGTAQQVVSTDKDGNTITTVVQPPVPGQTTQQVTVTKTSRSTSNSKMAPAPVTPVGPAPSTTSGPVGSNTASSNYDSTQNQVPPGAPLIKPVDVNVPAGTTLAIRINQYISVKTSHAGQRFSGEVVNPVLVGNSIAIPKGTPVGGVIDEAHRRGHFKGRSILELRLTSMRLNGQEYGLDTHDDVRTKKGKGKRSAAFIGGGAGAGMLIGGLASGGVGLVVGGLAGAGVGTAIGGLTGNRDLVIPAESVVNFRLADDLVVQPQ
jgi:hypothetical protein